MRTTLTIDPDVAQELARRRAESGRSLKRVVNDLLRAGLEQTRRSNRSPMKGQFTEPSSCGGLLLPPARFDEIGSLLAATDDMEIAGDPR